VYHQAPVPTTLIARSAPAPGRWAGVLAAILLLGAPTPAWAHGLAERYRLPLPLWLYLAGAAAAVALSFLVVARLPASRGTPAALPPRPALPRPARGLARAAAIARGLGRLLGVALLGLVVVAGVAGSQSPFHNIAPVLLWVVAWVGGGFVSAFLGDLWSLLNPWSTLARWAERLHSALGPGPRPARRRPWPEWLGLWPAVVLFLLFAWMELGWAGRDRPRTLAVAVLLYSALTWAGMATFGRGPWLRGAEVFSVVFGLLARFAPTAVRVTNPAACGRCSDPGCGRGGAGCLDCQDCRARAAPGARRVEFRPPALGLLTDRPAPPSLVALVALLLSSVTLDGLTETPLWAAGEAGLAAWLAPGADPEALERLAPALRAPVLAVALVVAPLVALAVYGLACRLMLAAAGAPPPGAARGETAAGLPVAGATLTTRQLMGRFALTFLPIALAYQVAHYLPFLLLAGQLVIPLASDPLGWGWDLFGTALYRLDVGIVGARFVWFTAVGAIVAGHAVAVYLGHLTALAVFGGAARARRSQGPILALMLGYTALSLWILAQPVVEP
jgi:hypothetical protein